MFSITNEVDIVVNTAEAINQTMVSRNLAGWLLVALVDKPATNETYLAWSQTATTAT